LLRTVGGPAGAVAFLVMGMEAAQWCAWETVLAGLAGLNDYSQAPVLWSRIVAMVAGYLVAGRLHRRRTGLARLRRLIAVGGLLSAGVIAIILRLTAGTAPLPGAAVPLFFWWRGAVIAQYHGSYAALNAQFNNLTPVLILLVLVSSAAGLNGGAVLRLGLYVVLFFLSGLTALAIAATRAVILESGPEAEAPSAGTWRRTAVVAAIGMIAVPAGIGWLLAGRDMAGAAAVLARFWGWTADLLEVVLTPIAVLIGWCVEPLVRWLAGREIVFPEPKIGPLPGEQFGDVAVRGIPPWVTAPAFAVGILLAAHVVRWIFMNSIRLGPEPEEEVVSESRESIWNWREVLGPVLGRRAPAAGRVVELRRDLRLSPARRIYRRFLALGCGVNCSRKHNETPYEYSKRFSADTGAPAWAVESLTELYVRARYGGHVTDVDEENEMSRNLDDIARSLSARHD
jgi:hypothetical protein